MPFILYTTKGRSALYHILTCALFTYILDKAWDLPAIVWWFIALNIFEFLMFGKDKLCAIKGWRRTPESTFHLMGFLGGFPGIFMGRKVFKHKTSKKQFYIPMWILFALQVLLALAYIEQTTVKNGTLLGFISEPLNML